MSSIAAKQKLILYKIGLIICTLKCKKSNKFLSIIKQKHYFGFSLDKTFKLELNRNTRMYASKEYVRMDIAQG